MAHRPSWTSRSRAKDSCIWRVVAYLETAGPVADQAALHGLLAKIRDLSLPLLSVRRIDPDE
jgi:hypothetical protein